MGIEIVTDGKCKGCPCMEVEVARLYGNEYCEFFPRCGNQNLCDHIEKFLRRKLAMERAEEA